jgi:protein-tyrosine phosphatase
VIDTHSHLLPGLDHGCPDLPTSVLMARAAEESGVNIIVCTPHLPQWDEPFVRRAGEVIEEVRAELAVAGVHVALKLGFEVDLSVAAAVAMEKLQALVIEGSGGAILLEMPYSGWLPHMEETVFRLSANGFLPVLAHPERNDRVQMSTDPLARCLKAGAVAQGTAGSLGGMFGRAAEKTFFRLLSEGTMSLLASDAHSFKTDGWTMGPMLAALEGRVGSEEQVTLTGTNPACLLAGERPQPVKPANGSTSWRDRARSLRLG